MTRRLRTGAAPQALIAIGAPDAIISRATLTILAVEVRIIAARSAHARILPGKRKGNA